MSRTAAALKLVNDLRATISHGGFELHYQPLVDARTCRPCGVEALLRWRHPVERLLLPESFIPLAETGLIDAIGAWVLRAACMQATAWRNTSNSRSICRLFSFGPASCSMS
jgi:EAL domain-containing protein (putative c-di-GMP-specific phosphodiesterase class I)